MRPQATSGRKQFVYVGIMIILGIMLLFGITHRALAQQPTTLDIIDAGTTKVRLYDMVFNNGNNFSGKLSVSLPQNNLTDIAISGTYDSAANTLAATVSELKLKLAGLELNLSNVSMSRTSLTAGAASLVLPAKLGGATGTVNDVVIDSNGLRIGSGSANFAVPDIKLGSNTGFAMTGVTGIFEVTADKTYKVNLSGTVAVNIPKANASVTGQVWIDSTGNIGGKLDAFSLSLAGLSLDVTGVELDNDGALKIASATLQAPAAWRGGPGASVQGVRISAADGLSFESADFSLPTLKVGGFSLGEGKGSLKKLADGYEITGKVAFSIPYVGKAAGCDGIAASATIYVNATGQTQVKLAPIPDEPKVLTMPKKIDSMEALDLALREVSVTLNCQIPIGGTGFFLDKISGTLTLSPASTKIEVGLGVSALKKVLDVSVLSATANASIQSEPFELAISGAVKMFAFEMANASATVTPTSFKATLNINVLVGNGTFSVNAWNDQRGFFFTASGKVTLGVGVGKIKVIPGIPYLQCPDGSVYVPFVTCSYGSTKWATANINIPPVDLTLGEVGAEAGAFTGDRWGFKGTLKVLGVSYGFFVDTQGNFTVTNVDSITLATPQQVAVARRQLLDALNIQKIANPRVVVDGTTYTLSPNADVQIDVPITRTQDAVFGLSRNTDLPTFSLITPSGDPITSGTTLPNVSYEETLTYRDGVYPQASTTLIAQNQPWTFSAPARSTTKAFPVLVPLAATAHIAPDILQLPTLMTAAEIKQLFPEAVQAPTAPAPQARLRALQASPDLPAVDVMVDGAVALGGINFKETTPYLNFAPGSHTIEIVPAGGGTPLLSSTVDLSDTVDYTFVAAGNQAALESVLVIDQNRPLPYEQARVRLGNLSPDMAAVDFALSGGAVITDNVNLAFKGIGNYAVLPAGTYTVEVRSAGTSTVLFTLPNVTFKTNSVYSLFIQGVASSAQLMVNLDDTDDKANVRFVQAVPDLAGAVDVRLNNGNAESKIFSAVGFTATLYSSQFADSYQFKVAPAGLTTPLYISTSVNLGLNQDYTVLAVGSAANTEALVLPDTNTLPQVGQARIRLVNASPDAPALTVVATSGPGITTTQTLFSNVAFKGTGSYVALTGGTYTLEVRNATTSALLLTVPVTFDTGRVYSLFALGLVSGSPAFQIVSTVDIIAQTNTDVKFAVDEAEVGTWKMVLGGSFGPGDKYTVNTSGNVPAPVLSGVSATAVPGTKTAQVSWTLSSYDDANISIFANSGAVTDTIIYSGTPSIVPIYQGNELIAGLDSPIDGTPYSTTVDLSWLPSDAYHLYVEAESGENEPVQLYADTPITVDNTATWPLTYIASVTVTQEGFDGIDLQWDVMTHPDVDQYIVHWGTSPLSLTDIITSGETTWETLSPVEPGETYYFQIGAYDLETKREALSQIMSATAKVADFTVTPGATQFNLIGGQETATTITLTTALDAYPDAVYLNAGDTISDGLDLDFGDNDFVVPSTTGLPVSFTIYTVDSLPDGVYDIPIEAVGYGVTHTLNLRVNLTAPYFTLKPSVSTVTLKPNASATLTVTTAGFYGSNDPIWLDIDNPPAGLSWDWSDEVVLPGESATLTLTNTGTLHGQYTLSIIGDNGVKSVIATVKVADQWKTYMPLMFKQAH
jgi:hypothetical protein